MTRRTRSLTCGSAAVGGGGGGGAGGGGGGGGGAGMPQPQIPAEDKARAVTGDRVAPLFTRPPSSFLPSSSEAATV